MYEIGKCYRDKLSKDIIQLTSITVGNYLEPDGMIHCFVDLTFRVLKRPWSYDFKRMRDIHLKYGTVEEKANVAAYLKQLLAVPPPSEVPQEASSCQPLPVLSESATECTPLPEHQTPSEDPDYHYGPLFRSSAEEPIEPEELEDPSRSGTGSQEV